MKVVGSLVSVAAPLCSLAITLAMPSIDILLSVPSRERISGSPACTCPSFVPALRTVQRAAVVMLGTVHMRMLPDLTAMDISI